MYIQYPPGPKDFDWDPEKNEANILKHKIDFADAAEITERDDNTRIISIRKGERDEAAYYFQKIPH
jgi:uncharacterized DUF497 family protein